MTAISAVWITIFLVLSLFILVSVLWLLRVALDWWLDIDYVKKIEDWIRRIN
jgi:hypothetical protein